MNRRTFIKLVCGFVALLLPDNIKPSKIEQFFAGTKKDREIDGFGTVAREGVRYAMVIDVGACIGCRRCVYACMKENNIPDTISPPWIEVFEIRSEVGVTGYPSEQELREGATTSYTEAPREGRWYLPVQCFHCDNPPCVKVCPVGATYKDKDGIVLMDYDRCIGCRFCVAACPYSARRFNWWKSEISPERKNPLVPVRSIGVVEKCTFCIHRVRRGKLPRCVEACPVQARRFGNLSDADSEVSRILAAVRGFRLLEEQNTEPRLWYITQGVKWTKA